MRIEFDLLDVHPNFTLKGVTYVCQDCDAHGVINGDIWDIIHGGDFMVWVRNGKQIYACDKETDRTWPHGTSQKDGK
jgi:hypothetical protein